MTHDDEEIGGNNGDKQAWYAVQVKRHSEARAVRHLALKAIPSFLPFVEIVRPGRAGRLVRLEALFPGYLFVRMAPWNVDPRGWHAVRWNPGVRSILGTGETPVPVPDDVIIAIQDRVNDLGFIRPGPRFSGGSRVRIRNGPLAGLEAIFERCMSRSGRVRVLLDLLGQERGVEVDEIDLESA
jgi:transcriptional antiterminator RfaH